VDVIWEWVIMGGGEALKPLSIDKIDLKGGSQIEMDTAECPQKKARRYTMKSRMRNKPMGLNERSASMGGRIDKIKLTLKGKESSRAEGKSL